jgi:cation transport regulator ChaC
MMMYFAYGSNMNPARMIARNMRFTRREFAVLHDYRLIFNKKATDGNYSYANIERAAGSVVEGVLYEFPDEDIPNLDIAESWPHQYIKTIVQVINRAGECIDATVYVANPQQTADGYLPTAEYMLHLLAGRDLLSEAYVKELQQQNTRFQS